MWSFINRYLKSLQNNKGLFNVSVGHTVSAMLGGLFFFILAYVMTVDSFGELGFVFALSLICANIALLGFFPTKIVQLAEKNFRIKSQAASIVIISSLVLGIPIAYLAGYPSIVFMIVGQSFFLLSAADFLGEKKYKKFAFILIGQKSSQIPLAILLFYFWSVEGAILGVAISSFAFGYKALAHLKFFKIDIKEFKNNFTLLMHGYSSELSKSVLAYSDKIFIVPLFGFGTLGIFQLGSQFLLALALLPNILFQYMLSEEASGKQKKKLRIYGIAASFCIATIVFFLPPIVIPNLLPHFIDSIVPAQIMVLGVVPLTVTYTLNAKFLATRFSKPVLISSIIFIVSEFSLMYNLGNWFGTVGLAWSLVIALSAQAVFSIIMYKLFQHKINSKQNHE